MFVVALKYTAAIRCDQTSSESRSDMWRSDAKYGTNDFVINSWKQGHSAKSSTGSLSTDGTVLFSYSLPIGYNIDNVLTALDYTSPDNFYSVTTSIHVGRAKSVADVVATPDSRTIDALSTLASKAGN